MSQLPGFISPSTNLLQLTHNTANSASTLKGYEVYYRAFDGAGGPSAADTARQAIEAAIGAQNATPETCLSLMQSLGFTRIFDGDGNDGPNGIRPLFEMPTTSLSTALQYNIFLDTTPPASSVSSAATDLANGPLMAEGTRFRIGKRSHTGIFIWGLPPHITASRDPYRR